MTGKELTSRENEHLEELLVAKQTAFEQKESQKKRLETLKINARNVGIPNTAAYGIAPRSSTIGTIDIRNMIRYFLTIIVS